MKKKILYLVLSIILLIAYLLLSEKFHLYLKCPIFEITGFYCPGCGITRMLRSLLKLDLYQAFRYNPLIFIMLPFIIILFINNLYSEYKNKKSWINKIPQYIWYIIIVILIIYGILRNIITCLQPTMI